MGVPSVRVSSGLRFSLARVIGSQAMDELVDERKVLLARIEQDREQLERVVVVVTRIQERLAHDERLLEDIDSALGHAPQLRIDEADIRLRGQRLEATAIEVLERRVGRESEIHYRQWYELLRDEGYLVAGKQPVNTFLSQINRSDEVEKVGRRTGLYRLSAAG